MSEPFLPRPGSIRCQACAGTGTYTQTSSDPAHPAVLHDTCGTCEGQGEIVPVTADEMQPAADSFSCDPRWA